MREALIRYALFLAETVTLLAALLAAFGILLMLVNRQARLGQRRPTVELKNLNQRYDELSRSLRDQLLPAPQVKAARKADRRQAKAEAKQLRREAKAHPTDGAPAASARPRLFVVDFHGDLRASQVSALREEVTAVLMTATPDDEVVVRLENPGGTVHEQGLAASQLRRLTERGLRLTVAVDKVAASGGYMMACVADRIVAAPFAVIGSIGVIDQVPNFYRMLDRVGVDVEMFKGGEAKRTVTMFGRTTEEDRARRSEQVVAVHELFKQFVQANRPSLDVARVATGEYWYGTQALELGLVDELLTSDDYLLAARDRADLFQVRFATVRSLRQRLTGGLARLRLPAALA